MNPITILALGTGSRKDLTLGAVRRMKDAEKLILRTGEADCAEYLKEQSIAFDTLDHLYDQAEDFEELTALCADAILKAAQEAPVVYAVLDPERDETVLELRKRGAVSEEVPGVPLSARALAEAGFPSVYRCAANQLPETIGDLPLLIEEIDDRLLAGELKLRLLEVYGEDQPVRFYPPAGQDVKRASKTIRLEDLDRQKDYDRTVCALILPLTLKDKQRYTFSDLVHVMAVLRGENGCPWDLSQDHHSLRPYLIEEAYETAAAIDEEDWAHVAEELGDVLLQVVFQANIGRQYGTFELSDITTAICKKMIERHPHIFSEAKADTAEAVTENWEEIKRRQRHLANVSDAMKDVSRGLPPLMRAEKVQKKAALAGFDLESPEAAIQKVHEEADEALARIRSGESPEEALGDLLFACVSAARLANAECETLLLAATEKFIQRYTRMESRINRDKKDLKSLTLQEKDVYWKSSKQL